MDQSEHFNRTELTCTHTGLCRMDPCFMEVLEDVRRIYDKPMVLSSAYRELSHPVEARKSAPGMHALGRAVDVLVSGSDAQVLLGILCNHVKVGGVGINQKGASGRFIHLDNRETPATWSY